MLYASLICTDGSCAEEHEAWGEPIDFDSLVCEACGCVLQALAFSDVRSQTVAHLPRRVPSVRLREAA
jgi:hypothetical protein